MGANNWRVCPKCQKKRDASVAYEEKRLKDMYGKVPAEEFMTRKKTHETLCSIPLGETLREDWELRTDIDGKFTIDYACSCNVCGWKFHYKRQEQALKAVQS